MNVSFTYQLFIPVKPVNYVFIMYHLTIRHFRNIIYVCIMLNFVHVAILPFSGFTFCLRYCIVFVTEVHFLASFNIFIYLCDVRLSCSHMALTAIYMSR